MKVIETAAKHIITKSRLPDAEYVVNPYIGCGFGCIYCYASFMGRFVNEPVNEWGNYVYVKTNAVDLFRKEITKLPGGSDLFLSSVTDPYQGIESKYRLTRGILEVLAETGYDGPVGVQTKSMMVLRDVDVLGRIPNIEVGMTITTTDDALGRELELRATSSSMRLDTLRKLHEEGIRTYAFVGPLLPHFLDKPELLDRLFSELSHIGISKLYVEHINMSAYIRGRLLESLSGNPKLRSEYEGADSAERRKALDALVLDLTRKHGLPLKFDTAIYHSKFKEQMSR